MSWVLRAALLLLAGCTSEFTPYGELASFRVLALRSERPYLAPGETTTLDALTHGDQPVSYAWSWCPLNLGQLGGFQCAVDQAELQQQVDAAVGPGVVTVPGFELGTTATTTF